MVTPSRGVIWPMTTTILACLGIGMNYSNIAVICRNTNVLRSMVSREGSKMASLHSCCIPAAAATAPQHIVPPLAAPPLVVICAADTNAAPSSSSSRPAYPPTARSAAGVASADDPPSARTNCRRGVGRAGGGGGGRPSRPSSAGVTLNGPSPCDFVDAIAGSLPPSCSDAWQRHTLRRLCATNALRCNRVCIWCKRRCSRCCTGRMSWGPSVPQTSSLGCPTSRWSREAQWIMSLLRNWRASMLRRMVEFYLIRLIYYLVSLFQQPTLRQCLLVVAHCYRRHRRCSVPLPSLTKLSLLSLSLFLLRPAVSAPSDRAQPPVAKLACATASCDFCLGYFSLQNRAYLPARRVNKRVMLVVPLLNSSISI
jgi:hypothetical protein